jgi:hypothetical protein
MPALPFDTNDVEPSLHEPSKIRQARFDLLTLTTHRPHVSHRVRAQIAEVTRVENAVEFGRHALPPAAEVFPVNDHVSGVTG